MDRQFTHMSHIIDDLLDVLRIRGGKATLRPEVLDSVQLIRQSSEATRLHLRENRPGTLDLPDHPFADRSCDSPCLGDSQPTYKCSEIHESGY